ncbi:MAG: hypothetical protein NWP80_01750 [Candidatus Gracilibacteria bacterium]|nr:hypothetical protein [Candidatus Gracilibacteria bacterium]
MNLILEEKLEKSLLSKKDIYEIKTFFIFLTEEKKINFINNFDNIVFKILKIEQDLKQSQEILLGKAISNIENAIKKSQLKGLKNASKQSIGELKNEM